MENERQKSFLDLASCVLVTAKKIAQKDPPPLIHKMKVEFREIGAWSETCQDQTSFYQFFMQNFESFNELPSLKSCAQLHHGIIPLKISNTEGIISKNPTFSEAYSFIAQELIGIIRNATEELQSFEIPPEELIERYNTKSAKWESKKEKIQVLIPIFNLKIEENIQFGEFLLAPITNQEKKDAWIDSPIFTRFDLKDLAGCSCRISSLYENNFYESIPNASISKKINDVLISLRLASNGYIQAPTILFLNENIRTAHRLSGSSTSRISGNHYAKSDVKKAQDIFDKLQELRKKNKDEELNLSLRRFNLALSKETPEDQLLDFAIALESLLVSGKDEITYRLSLRGAKLLANTEEPLTIQKQLKQLYDARSKIVHEGAMLSNLKMDAFHKEILKNVHSLTVKIIITFLNEYSTSNAKSPKSEILEKLDSTIIKNLKY